MAFTQAAASMAMDMPEAPSAMAMDMPAMDDFVPITLRELFSVSPRTEGETMMMNKRLFATLMPGLFVDPDTQKYTPLSNALWNMTAMDMPEHDMPGHDIGAP